MLGLDTKTFRGALIEAAVIAAGVFAALAADNWNDARKDRQLEQEFLRGLVLDLRANVDTGEHHQSQSAGLEGALRRVITAVSTGVNSWESPDDFAMDLILCTYLNTPELVSITFDELQSTGSMRLIRDSELRRRLAFYYEYFWIRSQFHAEYRRKEAAVEEALLGFLPLEQRLDALNENEPIPTADLDIDATIAQLQQVPKLVARLEDMVWIQRRMQTRYRFIEDDGNELIAHIEWILAAGD